MRARGQFDVAIAKHALSAMRHYCTYFDQYYLPRGLALYQSLCDHAGDFVLHVLCLDAQSFSVLTTLALRKLKVIHLDTFLAHDPELSRARTARSSLDFYFTCTPSLPIYLLAGDPDMMAISYVDADLYFFSSPEPLFVELGDAPIMAIEHRFPVHRDHSAAHGRFNVGMQYFRRSAEADQCLQRWRQQCLDWCHNRAEAGRFGDQKYLDEWPALYPGLHIMRHPGANLAPWNLARHQLSWQARSDKHLLVDEQPLIFFHFHRTRRVFAKLYDPTLAEFEVRSSPLILAIFRPYVRALERAEASVRGLLPTVNLSVSQREKSDRTGLRAHLSSLRGVAQKLLAGDYLWL
jgi:hypothetical protein